MCAIALMIVGAQKAGTTSLLHYLRQHPQLAFHPQREMTYFLSDREHELGQARMMKRYFGEAPRVAYGAKHVMVMYSPSAVNRLHLSNPEMQVVAVLRHPIERAYSAYWYARRRGWESEVTFEGGLGAERSRLEEGWERWRACAYLFNSIYEPHVRGLFERHGRSSVHVYLTEDIRDRTVDVCQTLFAAAGVDPAFRPGVLKRHNPAAKARSVTLARLVAAVLQSGHPVKRAARRLLGDRWAYRLRHGILRLNERPFTPPAMNAETRARLIEDLAPHNERLSQLIGRDLSRWNQ